MAGAYTVKAKAIVRLMGDTWKAPTVDGCVEDVGSLEWPYEISDYRVYDNVTDTLLLSLLVTGKPKQFDEIFPTDSRDLVDYL
jgi:hypothetical protein